MATTKIRFTIRKDADFGEYELRKFENNRLCKGFSYFTDDWDDARSTMLESVARVTDKYVYHSIKQSSKNSITITIA